MNTMQSANNWFTKEKRKKTGCLLFKAVNVLLLVVTLLKGAQNVSPLMGVCVCARVLFHSVLTLAPAGFKAEAVIQTDSSHFFFLRSDAMSRCPARVLNVGTENCVQSPRC